MGGEAQLLEDIHGVGFHDLAGRTIGIDGQHQAHEPAHDMGVAVAAKGQHGFCARPIHGGLHPDLAGAASDLVVLIMGSFGQWLQLAAKFDEVAIAIFPLVEQVEVSDDVGDGSHGS